MLEKPFYTILELFEEWADKHSDHDLDYVFKNKINYGIYLHYFRTIALVKTEVQYIPVAGCVIHGVVASNQPVINIKNYSLRHWIKLARYPIKKIERIQFLSNATEIYEWDESKPNIVETESYKDNQKLTEDKAAFEAAVQRFSGRKLLSRCNYPSFDESHKQGSLEPEEYNVEGNSIFNAEYLDTRLRDFFRLQKNIDSWNPLQKKEVNWNELYFYFLKFKNGDLRVLHEDRMRIEKSFNSNQGATEDRPQLQGHKKTKPRKQPAIGMI